MSVVGAFVCSELGPGKTGCSGECYFGVMYCEWYGACDFVVNVFHARLNFALSMVLGFVSMFVV